MANPYFRNEEFEYNEHQNIHDDMDANKNSSIHLFKTPTPRKEKLCPHKYKAELEPMIAKYKYWGSLKDCLSNYELEKIAIVKIKQIREEQKTPVFCVKRHGIYLDSMSYNDPVEKLKCHYVATNERNIAIDSGQWINKILLQAATNEKSIRPPAKKAVIMEENFDKLYQQLLQAQKTNDDIIMSSNNGLKYIPRPKDGRKMSDKMEENSGHENMGLATMDYIQKPKIHDLAHSKCGTKLSYSIIHWKADNLRHYHRPPFDAAVIKIEQKKLKISEITINPILVTCNDISEESGYIIRPEEKLNKMPKLCIKSGKFLLFEHIDQNPMFMNNFGMATKLKRYIYNTDLSKPVKESHVGPYGIDVQMKVHEDRIPLIGQVDTEQYKGVSIIENNVCH